MLRWVERNPYLAMAMALAVFWGLFIWGVSALMRH